MKPAPLRGMAIFHLNRVAGIGYLFRVSGLRSIHSSSLARYVAACLRGLLPFGRGAFIIYICVCVFLDDEAVAAAKLVVRQDGHARVMVVREVSV